MRALDIVSRLASILPLKTDLFTTTVDVSSISRSGFVATVECLERHGVEVGDAVVIIGAKTPIVISSLTRSGTVGTAVLASRHDLTPAIASQIVISGSNEPEFNGTFSVSSFVDELTLEFTMDDSGPTTATGTPILENGESQLRDYNGAYAVLETPTDSSFTIQVDDDTLPDPIGAIEARVKPRVSATASIERALEVYTSQDGPSEAWGFVVLGDAVASKNRAIRSDAVDNLQRTNFFRQQVIEPFSFFVFLPSSNSIGGRFPRDLASDLFRPICQSILFEKFDSGLFVGKQNPTQFVGHGTWRYDTAVYAHEYSFQQVADLLFEDTVGPDLDVAFRVIDLTMIPTLPGDAGTALQSLKATPSLDEPAEE